ncbi:hypothetical protein J3R83DRAFT_13538 [Lanmaoa asiatica]|nr:hypothetical protein J3R83DRAFT_13538 [Lanmaoa asiatica]
MCTEYTQSLSASKLHQLAISQWPSLYFPKAIKTVHCGLTFHDCNPGDNRFLLLLKSILVFESGRQEDAMLRVEYLVGRANNDATYLYTQLCALGDPEL